MRLEQIENEPVALGEVPAAAPAIEEKRLRMPKRRWNRHLELLLDVEGGEPEVVRPSPVQLALGQEGVELDSADVPLLLAYAERMLLQEKAPDRLVVGLDLRILPGVLGRGGRCVGLAGRRGWL